MPELPEVETHVRDLQSLVGMTFQSVWTDTKKAFCPSFANFQKKLPGKRIKAIRRRAKYIIFDLSGDLTLVVHFRMTGHFLMRKPADDMERFVRHRFTLTPAPRSSRGQALSQRERGQRVVDLRFDDIRKFGTLTLCTASTHEETCRLVRLGPEPLAREFTLKVFRELIANWLEVHHGALLLKAILLNQEFVAGIGNIYADEICFTAGLHPASRIEKLSATEIKELHTAIICELKKGVKNRGTTVGEFVDSKGRSGNNQKTLRAYKRHGLPCKICGIIMQKMKIGQRTTTFCSKCQKKI